LVTGFHNFLHPNVSDLFATQVVIRALNDFVSLTDILLESVDNHTSGNNSVSVVSQNELYKQEIPK